MGLGFGFGGILSLRFGSFLGGISSLGLRSQDLG